MSPLCISCGRETEDGEGVVGVYSRTESGRYKFTGEVLCAWCGTRDKATIVARLENHLLTLINRVSDGRKQFLAAERESQAYRAGIDEVFIWAEMAAAYATVLGSGADDIVLPGEEWRPASLKRSAALMTREDAGSPESLAG